jgi:hypothetical protein
MADLPLEELRAGLAVLLEAFEFARATSSNAWDFAVERSVLSNAGMSVNELRWLLASRFAEHGIDLTPSDTERRPIRITKSFRFLDDSCFILTVAGVDHARSLCRDPAQLDPGKPNHQPSDASGKSIPQAGKPHWDRNSSRLIYEGIVCVILNRAAENLEAVLDAFEASGWAPQIHDPFPAGKPGNRKRRLHNTINALNRCQSTPRIHFASADSGRAIRWTLIPLPPPAETVRTIEPAKKRNGKPSRRAKPSVQKSRRKRPSPVHRNLKKPNAT